MPSQGEMSAHGGHFPLCVLSPPAFIQEKRSAKFCQMCKKVIVFSVTNSIDKFEAIAI